MTNPNVLYRVFNDAGDLLYVGATTNPGSRFNHHALHKPWWDEAASMTMERFATVDELMVAEADAIATEGPRYNEIHTHKPAPWSRKRDRSPGEGTIYQRASDGLWVGKFELPPGADGKRRQKVVASKSRAVAEAKFYSARAEHGL